MTYISPNATTNYGDPHPFGLNTPHAVLPDTEWAELFFAPQPPVPILIAAKGFNWTTSAIRRPHHYLDAAGFWRDTMTDVVWSEPHSQTYRSKGMMNE